MARLYQSGFEINSVTDAVEWDTVAGAGLTIQSDIKRSGSYAMKCTHSSAGNFYVRHEFAASTSDTYTFSCWFRLEESVTSSSQVFACINPGLTVRHAIFLNTDDTLYLNATGNGSSSALTKDTWYHLKLTINCSTKVITAYLNGTSFATVTSGAAINCGCVECGLFSSGATGIVYFDDVIINDNTGDYETGDPGEQKLVLLSPTSAGDSNGWLKTDASAGDSNNYNLVDENPPDDATTFIETKTNAAADFFNTTNPLSGSNTVYCVAVSTRHRGASASAVSSFKAGIKKEASGTLSQAATSTTPTSTTWRTNANAVPRLPVLILYKDPDGSDWTTSTLDTLQVGVTCTSANTNYAQVSALWVYVSYIPNPIIQISANIPASSTTPDIAATIKANILAAIVAASTTPNVATTIKINVLANIIASSTTPDVSTTLARKILANIIAASSTSDVASTSKRNILAAIVGASTTPDISSTAVRQILASITAGSTTGDIVANFVILLAASIQASSVTPDIASTFLRRILAGITAASATPDIAATLKRNILSSITATSTTPQDVLATLKRNLLAAIQASSVTPDDVTTAATVLFQLVAAITATSTTPDIASTSKRNLLASVIANSSTGNILASIVRNILSSITAATTTSEIVIGLFVLSEILNRKLDIESLTSVKDIFSVTKSKSISERTEV